MLTNLDPGGAGGSAWPRRDERGDVYVELVRKRRADQGEVSFSFSGLLVARVGLGERGLLCRGQRPGD